MNIHVNDIEGFNVDNILFVFEIKNWTIISKIHDLYIFTHKGRMKIRKILRNKKHYFRKIK